MCRPRQEDCSSVCRGSRRQQWQTKVILMRLILTIMILAAMFSGCSEGRVCPQEFGGGENGEPVWMTACTARLTFDEENSRLVVTQVEANRTEYWHDFVLVSPTAGGHVAFNQPATSDSPTMPTKLRDIASGPIQEGQFLGLCGSADHPVGIQTRRGPLSAGAWPLPLKACWQ
jgi:hypothetical protein